jgi:Flp pilus assembly protein TadD
LRDGQYTVAIDLRKALQTAFLKPNGERWIGRARHRTELTLHVRNPTTANNASQSEQARGRLALKERRYGDALAAFLRAAAAGPPDVGLSAELGSAYLGIRAFPDAVTWLERAISLSSPAYKSALPEMLALAYVGNGDDVNAARILRSRGKSAEETAREVIRLRGVAKRRQ